MNEAIVIGGGFSGLAAACYLAAEGRSVRLLEKNATVGGRARLFETDGFRFDMGPSWYWMPDVFEEFFSSFGKTVSDFYDLKKLDPGFQIFFDSADPLQVPAQRAELDSLFESIEPGSAAKLALFLKDGKFKYVEGMQNLARKPSLSWTEFISFSVVAGVMRSHIFRNMRDYVRTFFKDPRLVALMEFPVLFLGAKPQRIPALYSLMNFAALEQGTFYPMGGMNRIVDGMEDLALSLGVSIETNCCVEKIDTKNRSVNQVFTNKGAYTCDSVIATGDYHHIEQKLLPPQNRNYNDAYWEKRVMAPSSLIFYLGISKKIKRLIHHNLFFDRDFDLHASEIYDEPRWPLDPLFYVCCPSKTDPSVAPSTKENLFILVPIAAGLEDTEELREHCYRTVMNRLEKTCGEAIRDFVEFKRSYCVNDFVQDYHAYKGNAYGLANTLMQTAVFKPSIRNKTLDNLFYAGQLTVPGPGVPPALISGKIASQQVLKFLKKSKHEVYIR